MYTAGYFNGPTEIGVTGAAAHDSADTLQFESGYKWVDADTEQLFLCRWSSTGKCEWSHVYSCVGLDHDSVRVKFHDDLMYFVCVAESLSTSTTQTGLFVSCVSTSTGDFIWEKTLQGGAITCDKVDITDTGNFF